MGKGFIEEGLYRKICSVLPIVCVDIIVTDGKRFLLGKRINEPAKGQWFFPGGRVHKGETAEQAAVRKIKEEIGLSLHRRDLRFVGCGETIFEGKEGSAKNRHTVNIVFQTITKKKDFCLDVTQNSELKWFGSVSPKWHPYVKQFLKRVGF